MDETQTITNRVLIFHPKDIGERGMSTKDQAGLVGIESIEHASAVLRRLRSNGSSQRKYQTLGDASVFSLDNFNKTVIESASTLSHKHTTLNARFEGDRNYAESEIIHTKFNTASTDGGDLSGFEYDSFGDRSPQKPSKISRSLDDMRISAEFKKMLTKQVCGEQASEGEIERDEFGILEDDEDLGDGDPFATGKLEALTKTKALILTVILV